MCTEPTYPVSNSPPCKSSACLLTSQSPLYLTKNFIPPSQGISDTSPLEPSLSHLNA